jgi:hypothetical protein
MNHMKKMKELSQLPSFPSSSLGEQFSQDAIKEAITGRKEVNEKVEDLKANFLDGR